MRFFVAIVIALTAACTEGGDAFGFYDHAESGTTWKLVFGTGTQLHGIACPVIATRTMHLPDTDGMQCDAGCTCDLSLYEGCSGEIVETDYVGLNLFESCTDDSKIHADQDIDPSNLWFRAYWGAPGSDYDCEYDVGMVEVR
jgi:hypothetical protein